MAEPLATRVVRPCARQNDAVGVESFCCVQIGFEQKRSASQEKSLQKDAHGEICGLGVLHNKLCYQTIRIVQTYVLDLF